MLTSSAGWWIGYSGESASFTELQRQFPGLELRAEGTHVLLGGLPLQQLQEASLREDIARFTDVANTILVLSDARPVKPEGPLYRLDEEGASHHRILAETGRAPEVGYPVTLSATGTATRKQPRPFGERVL